MTKEQIKARIKELAAEMNGLSTKGAGDLTDADITRATEIKGEIARLRSQLEAFDDIEATNKSVNEWLGTPVNTAPAPSADPAPGAATTKRIVIPASVIRTKTKYFKADENMSAQQKAYAFGMFFMATCVGNEKAARWCKEHGIGVVKAHTEGNNSQGGFLVPAQFENDLIDLREMYGVIRANANNRTMVSDTSSRPRRKGGLVAYFAGENKGATESNKNWDRVSLTAQKLIVLAKFSSELNEDAVINIADDLAKEIAYAFANKEDDCGFNGDGSSGYGEIVGFSQSFLRLSGTIANIAGLVVASGNGYAAGYDSIQLRDFTKLKGRLPAYVTKRGNIKWYCHKSFYNSVMEELMLAAGGATAEAVAAGRNTPNFLGYDVEFAQVMPALSATNQICAYLGDMSEAADFGDRRATTIAVSEHVDFAADEINIRGTERFDLNVHDVGNASGTASQRVAGPMVALITGNS